MWDPAPWITGTESGLGFIVVRVNGAWAAMGNVLACVPPLSRDDGSAAGPFPRPYPSPVDRSLASGVRGGAVAEQRHAVEVELSKGGLWQHLGVQHTSSVHSVNGAGRHAGSSSMGSEHVVAEMVGSLSRRCVRAHRGSCSGGISGCGGGVGCQACRGGVVAGVVAEEA